MTCSHADSLILSLLALLFCRCFLIVVPSHCLSLITQCLRNGYGTSEQTDVNSLANAPATAMSISYSGQAKPFDLMEVTTWMVPAGLTLTPNAAAPHSHYAPAPSLISVASRWPFLCRSTINRNLMLHPLMFSRFRRETHSDTSPLPIVSAATLSFCFGPTLLCLARNFPVYVVFLLSLTSTYLLSPLLLWTLLL